jgi:signal transduction histidine kinase
MTERAGTASPGEGATHQAPLPKDLHAILDGLPIAIFVLAADGRPVYANAAAQALLGDAPDPSVLPEQLADRYHAVLAGTDQPYPTERMPIVRALAGDATTVEDMEIAGPERKVPVEVWAAPVFAGDSSIAYAVAAFHDVSARRQAQSDAARLYEETVRQSRWLAAVRDIQFSVLSGAGLDGALDLVARQARDLIAGDCTSIGIPEGEGVLRIGAADGLEADVLLGQRLSTTDSIMGEVIAMGAAAILDDLSCHGTLADPVVRLDLGPALFVPLSAEGRAFGSLCVARRRGGELFTEREVAAAEAFANQAAMAVQIGRAQRELAHLAVARDRERRSQDLHDRVIRSLVSTRERLSASRTDGDAGQRAEAIDHAIEGLGEVIDELRGDPGLSHGATAERSGMETELVALAEEFEGRTGIVTVVDVHADDDVIAGLVPSADDIVELVRQALSEVRERTGARTCEIQLAPGSEGAVLCVQDDGPTGGDASGAQSVLIELAAGAGAGCHVNSTPGRGTVVRFVLRGKGAHAQGN